MYSAHLRRIVFLGLCLVGALSLTVGPGGAVWAAAGTAASAAADSGLLRGPQILQFLDRTVAWYRSRTAQEQIATEPADVVALADSRETAVQIVQSGFSFARAAAALAVPSGLGSAQKGAPPRDAQLQLLLDQLQQRIRVAQVQLPQQRAQLDRAAGVARRGLEARAAALSAQITLLQVRHDAVQQFLDLTDSAANATSTEGLKGRIETLASSVDVESGDTGRNGSSSASGGGLGSATGVAGAAGPAAGARAAAAGVGGNGIWDLSERALTLSGKVGRVDQFIQQTTALGQASRGMRELLLAALRRDSAQSDSLTPAAGPVGAGPVGAAQLSAQLSQLQALTQQFRQITAALVPLARIGVLLGQYQGDLADWRDSVHREYLQTLRALGIRLAVLAFVLVAVVTASELWRRAANRYVRDARRRYQLLLLRRFVLWFVIAIVLASTLASRLDSFVTFAGLLTAGIAVAMQNVILSVVGYFFLIGKFGVRVGDRVQIGTVLGEIIDVGLVRMHLMELSADALNPTGRVVAFSNSIVFQATGGLFKQIPGVHIGWHELTLTLASAVDSGALRQRLMAAAESALTAHKEELERQRRELERASFAPGSEQLRPSVSLRFLASGVEATVRYPIDQRSAAQIDEDVSRELLKAAQRESRSAAPINLARPELTLNRAPGS